MTQQPETDDPAAEPEPDAPSPSDNGLVEDDPVAHRSPGGSSGVTRWFLPGLIVWAGLLLSAWVYTKKIPEELRQSGGLRLLTTLVATPMVALLTLVLLRIVGRKRDSASRTGDMLVLWVMAFLFAVHASVLAVAIGMIESLSGAIPVATGLLMFGMAPVLHVLEPGSSMGIRTRATLNNVDVWRQTHHLAAKLFGLAGVIALAGVWVKGPVLVAVAVGPGVLALAISVVYAARISRDVPSDEEPAEEIRPTDDAGSS